MSVRFGTGWLPHDMPLPAPTLVFMGQFGVGVVTEACLDQCPASRRARAI